MNVTKIIPKRVDIHVKQIRYKTFYILYINYMNRTNIPFSGLNYMLDSKQLKVTMYF